LLCSSESFIIPSLYKNAHLIVAEMGVYIWQIHKLYRQIACPVIIFRSPAIPVSATDTLGPVALRRRFSPGLPLTESDYEV
jgi:hypothetical protein